MNVDQQLYWHQGLFLQPQHLQHADRLNLRRFARQREIDVPYNWGVVSMLLAEKAMASGRIVPEQLSVIFRDGTLVEYPGNAIIEPRVLAPGELVNGARTVYLGIRQMLPGRGNISVFETLDAAAQASTRYATLADPETVPDLLTAEGEAGMRGIYYVLRLFWDTEVKTLGGYDLLPLAVLERDGELTRLARHFTPPVVQIGASPGLAHTLRDVRDELAARARQLEIYKQPADGGFAELDASQWRAFQAMMVMNRYAPWLGHLVETPEVHPWHVYGVLRQLAGELSAFSLHCDAFGVATDGNALVPPYRHEEAGEQIVGLTALIEQLLDEITLGAEQLVLFSREGEFWSAELSEAMTTGRNRYYLVISARDAPDGLLENAPRDAKLGATSAIDRLVTLSLPGIELLALSAAPAGLPRRPGAVFFRIETVADAWQQAMHERALSLFYPELYGHETVTVELAIVRK